MRLAAGRARGAEMHLLQLSDFISERLANGPFAFSSSLDIDGAFDAAPHWQLVCSLEDRGVGFALSVAS